MQANQQVTFLTGDGEDIRGIPCYFNAQAELRPRALGSAAAYVLSVAYHATAPLPEC